MVEMVFIKGGEEAKSPRRLYKAADASMTCAAAAVCQAGGYMTVQAAAEKVGIRGRAVDGQERHSSTDDQVLAPRIYLFTVAPKYLILSFMCRPVLSQFVHPGSAPPANCDCICERA